MIIAAGQFAEPPLTSIDLDVRIDYQPSFECVADFQNSSRRKSLTRNLAVLKAAYSDIVLAFKQAGCNILTEPLTYYSTE